MEFITLTKDDPEFASYLLGTFSRSHRALPVETYHPQTERERVTFRVVPLVQMQLPRWWMIYARAARPELLPLTLGPSIAAWLNHREQLAEWTRWPSWFALLGLFFLHTAAFLLNDVQDHLRGLDRVNRRRGSQVIQRGWVSAAALRKWALVNLGLAIGFGVPALFNAPLQLALVCGAALLALAVVLQNRLSRFGLSDIALFFLFGPLLTAGTALASFGTVNRSDGLLGLALGGVTVWVLQARQFEYLFRAKPEGSRTWLGYWDFERARLLFIGEGFLLLLVQPAVALVLGVPLPMLALLPLAAIPMILSINRLWQAASPLSSRLADSDRWALGTHLAWTLWWLLELGVAWL